MTTKIFNPAQFAATDGDVQTATPSKAEAKEYKLTGNSSRDQVRKMLYDIFSLDEEFSKQIIASTIEGLEDEISRACPDPKAKKYRDTSRALQTKLKGSRFQELRAELLSGQISIEEVCSEDFLNGKKVVPTSQQLKTAPVAHAPSSLGVKPVGPPGVRGIPGQPVNPRGGPAPGMFRPQQMGQLRPKAPIQAKLLTQPIPRMESTADLTLSHRELPQVAALESSPQAQQSQAHNHLEETPPRKSEAPAKQTAQQVDFQTPRRSSDVQPVTPEDQQQNQPSNHQALNEDDALNPHEASNVDQTMHQNETVFESFIESKPQDLSQMIEQSVEMSQDQLSQDQIQPGHMADLPPKSKKKKKTKKKKQSESETQQSILAELGEGQQAPQQQNLTVKQTPEPEAQQLDPTPDTGITQHPAIIEEPLQTPKHGIEETKENKNPASELPMIQNPETPKKPTIQIDDVPFKLSLQPHQLQQQSVPVMLSPSKINAKVSGSDAHVNTLIQENARLRDQLRQQTLQEDSFIQQQHQIQLLDAQLKARDEQIVQLRWQLQQNALQYLKELDELRLRLKRAHLESQEYRDLISSQRFESPQYRQHDELMVVADRGSNNTAAANRNSPTFNQHGGTTDAGTQQEALDQLHLDSGEQDEGVRDDGHFYRQEVTTDEGTGGAGFNNQSQLQQTQQPQRIVDVSSSGGGQMHQQNNSLYQQQMLYGGGTDSQANQIDDYDNEDDDMALPEPHESLQAATTLNHQSHLRQSISAARSSSGSAFGEGNNQQNAQDDSEEEGGMMSSMGMMGNRQGSSHHVEDDSGGGLLDIVAQSSSCLRKNLYSGANNQSQQHRLLETQQIQHVSKTAFEDQEGEQHQSNSEEGGGLRSSHSEEDHGRSSDNLSLKQQLVEPVDETPDYFSQSHHHHLHNQDPDVRSVGGETTLSHQQPQQMYTHLMEEEEKDDPATMSYTQLQQMSSQVQMQQQYGRTAAVISDNVERPQPYHPRQQQRVPATQASSALNQGVNVGTGGGSAVLTSANSMVYPQHAHMQGESINNSKRRESGVAQHFPKPQNSIGGVAVVSRSNNAPANKSNGGQNLNTFKNLTENSMQSGDRPGGQPQRRGNGNKQQLQVPPLPPTTTNTGQSHQSTRDSRGQGQGGGVVNQNQSSSQTRNQGRNSRGTQRNNHQQQIFANTPSSGNTQMTQVAQEQSPPRIAQVFRPPASQASSSAAQLPLSLQAHVTGGGATGVKSKFLKPDSGPEISFQSQSQYMQAFQNNQQEGGGNSQASVQASTMPASQASVSGQGSSIQRQQSNSHQQQQNIPAIATTRYHEGVVHTAGQQFLSTAANTQALGGAMMGSSGSGLIASNTNVSANNNGGAGDMGSHGGMAKNQRSVTQSQQQQQQMNMETGSTTEFSGAQSKQNQWQTAQQVSSPPSTLQRVSQFQSQQAAHHQFHNFEHDHTSASGGGEVDSFVQSLGVTPLAHQNAAKCAIQSTSNHAPIQFYPPHQHQRQQNNQGGYSSYQQASNLMPARHSAYQQLIATEGVVDLAGDQHMASQVPSNMMSSGGAASQQPLNQGESGANTQLNTSSRGGNGNFQPSASSQSLQQLQQAHSDSQKTSGANTPSKDGANTPTYREQVQHNSQIFNLTSMRLHGLSQSSQQQQQLQRVQYAQQPDVSVAAQDEDNSQSQVSGQHRSNLQSSSGGENAIIPRAMFE